MEMSVIDQILAEREKNKPKTISVLEDIKSEIEDQKSRMALQDDDLHWYREGLNDAIKLIDKHISGKKHDGNSDKLGKVDA